METIRYRTYIATRSIVRIVFWMSIAAVLGTLMALAYSWGLSRS